MKLTANRKREIQQHFANVADAYINEIERGYISGNDLSLENLHGNLRHQTDDLRSQRDDACSEIRDLKRQTIADIRRQMLDLIRDIKEERYQQIYLRLLLTDDRGAYFSLNKIGQLYYGGASGFKYWLDKFKVKYLKQWKLVHVCRLSIARENSSARQSLNNAVAYIPSKDKPIASDTSTLEDYLKGVESKHGEEVADIVAYAVETFGRDLTS